MGKGVRDPLKTGFRGPGSGEDPEKNRANSTEEGAAHRRRPGGVEKHPSYLKGGKNPTHSKTGEPEKPEKDAELHRGSALVR